jgi:hypothetical protein
MNAKASIYINYYLVGTVCTWCFTTHSTSTDDPWTLHSPSIVLWEEALSTVSLWAQHSTSLKYTLLRPKSLVTIILQIQINKTFTCTQNFYFILSLA